MIASLDARMGISVDVVLVQPKSNGMVLLPRLRPAHIAAPAASAKPAKRSVKAARNKAH